MEIIKCNECGKELSKKAEICPNCGVRIKKRSFISKAFRFFEIIGVLIVIGLICIVAYVLIRNGLRNSRKNHYVGTWELITSQERIEYTDESHTTNQTIIIDKKLNFENGKIYKNIYNGLGSGESCFVPAYEELTERCENTQPQLRLNQYDKTFAIDFNTTSGSSVLLCFKDSDKDTIKQISCKGAYNGDFSANGGIDEDFDIIYKRVK